MINRRNYVVVVIMLIGLIGCATTGLNNGWQVLIEGENGLENFNRSGDANWSALDGSIQATSGSGSSHLVSKNSYRDYVLRVEFWTSHDANSGIHMRCDDPADISSRSCYEVNIYDQREDPRYGTGAIVNVAEIPEPRPKAGGKWNSMEISADGDHLMVILNGSKTVDVRDSAHREGVFGLQWGRGTIKFRKVEIRPL